MRVFNDQVVFEQFMRSNIPRQEKGIIRQWFDKVTDGKFTQTLEKLGVQEQKINTVGSVLIAGVEAGAAGAILGTLHAELKNGLDTYKAPIDASVGGIALGAAAWSGSEHLKTVGISCMSVFGFRKFDQMLRIKKELTGKGLFAGETPDEEELTEVEEAAKEVFNGDETPLK